MGLTAAQIARKRTSLDGTTTSNEKGVRPGDWIASDADAPSLDGSGQALAMTPRNTMTPGIEESLKTLRRREKLQKASCQLTGAAAEGGDSLKLNQ